MIYVRLMGGLGNQMFQYAAGKRLAIKNNANLVLDLSHLKNQPAEETPREYELYKLKLDADIIYKPAENRKRLFKDKSLLIIREAGLDFDKNILSLSDNVLLIGYWQSYKYFQDIDQQIRKDFKFKDSLSVQKKKILSQIRLDSNPVAIQIRRGDYVTSSSTNKFHGLIPLDYYEKAAKYIAKRINDPHFYVISDDSEWCEKNLRLSYPTTFIRNGQGKGEEDMRLMSNCKHHIIANSSFGWWGAWLSEKPDKIVVAPKQWFKGTSVRMEDRLLPGWISL
jgi:hypothetical protein